MGGLLQKLQSNKKCLAPYAQYKLEEDWSQTIMTIHFIPYHVNTSVKHKRFKYLQNKSRQKIITICFPHSYVV